MFAKNLVVWPLLLDNIFPGQMGVWSFRRLRSSYTSFCCEIRRDSDNTSTDVFFDSSGNLSLSSAVSSGGPKLSFFLGASNGFIRQLYDQSGNANPLVQLTIANQPQIATSGVINTINYNSRSAMTLNGSTTYLSSASNLVMPATMGLFTVSESVNNSIFIEHSPNVNSNDGFYIYGVGADAVDVTRSGVSLQVASADWTGSAAVALGMTYDGSTLTGWKRNVSQFTGSGSLSGNATQILYVGARGGSSLFMTGQIAEILLFNNSLQNSQRYAIFANQENFYGV